MYRCVVGGVSPLYHPPVYQPPVQHLLHAEPQSTTAAVDPTVCYEMSKSHLAEMRR